ncbi:hypothetical protein DAMA08_017420 [Martiniozyma asiatica (nom. inval.)]|nr:hypothetical protein DAMA08_017420 [Martiniozyma asiatica]
MASKHQRPITPKGWIAVFDEHYQEWYYVFEETGATQWEPPPGTKLTHPPPPPPPPPGGPRTAEPQVIVVQQTPTAPVRTGNTRALVGGMLIGSALGRSSRRRRRF